MMHVASPSLTGHQLGMWIPSILLQATVPLERSLRPEEFQAMRHSCDGNGVNRYST